MIKVEVGHEELLRCLHLRLLAQVVRIFYTYGLKILAAYI